MPARSVVIEKLSKFTGEHHEFLTPGEYTQLTGPGRAARHRRGRVRDRLLEPVRPVRPGRGPRVAAGPTRCTSSFRPTYNMAANLVARYPAEVAHHLLNLSFAQYRADRDVVALERQLERNRELLERQRRRRGLRARRRRGVPGAAGGARRRPARTRGAAARSLDAIDTLRPGDVLAVRRGGGRAVVLKHEGSRGGSRVLALGSSREVFKLGPGGLRRPAAADRQHRAAQAVRAAQLRVPQGRGRRDARGPVDRAGQWPRRPRPRPTTSARS